MSSFHPHPRENVLLLNIFGRHAVRNSSRRKAEFRFGTCPGRPPRQGSLADMDHIVLSRPISRRVPVLLPVLTAIGPAVMAGSPPVSTRRCGDGRFRRLDQRQSLPIGKRMLGIPTPNFPDATSELDGSTTTGLSQRPKATRLWFVILVSLPPPCPVQPQNTGETPG
jgi:hypothetical protein